MAQALQRWEVPVKTRKRNGSLSTLMWNCIGLRQMMQPKHNV